MVSSHSYRLNHPRLQINVRLDVIALLGLHSVLSLCLVALILGVGQDLIFAIIF
jgi:hypothetical protein